MNQCLHDLIDREEACADGMCPICTAKENSKLWKLADEMSEWLIQNEGDEKIILPILLAFDAFKREAGR